MPKAYTENDAVGLLGSSVQARRNTRNAIRGERGEVVRADPYQDQFTIVVEWGGRTNQTPRFDEFTKPESNSFLDFHRRSV